ncbi:MAG: hypothetical protein BWX59_00945 [Bacteroidetes bacterium ADurb.Bin028]|nr:MAG: hypothetical protein BWX59_00945 [Bacteroidetes bacterium ADurb.Bin028]
MRPQPGQEINSAFEYRKPIACNKSVCISILFISLLGISNHNPLARLSSNATPGKSPNSTESSSKFKD